MVHALTSIRRLLTATGSLIDIHPICRKPGLFVCFITSRHFVGYLQEADDFVEYAQAQAAQDQAVRDGIFHLDYAGEFDFCTHADTLPDLQAYLAENWKDAILPPELLAEMRAACDRAGAGEILLVEQVSIARLLPGNITP